MLANKHAMQRKYLFRKFLNWYWLRPESAILLALRAESYANTLKYFGDGQGTVDISCGDGAYSFLTLGGELSIDTDAYRAINASQTVRKNGFDAYDHFDPSYIINITKQPKMKYQFGTDWKNNLIKKARELKFYSSLIQHNNNHPLPFSTESMTYVFSNSAYWVDNFEEHLKDLVRIAKKGARIVLQMKTSNIRQNTSATHLQFMGKRFYSVINADRVKMWKGLSSKKELLNIFGKLRDVEIETFDPIYGDILDVIWNVGMRPLFNPLVKMANNVRPEVRSDIKQEWCDVFYKLFCDMILNYKVDQKKATEHLIVLQKI